MFIVRESFLWTCVEWRRENSSRAVCGSPTNGLEIMGIGEPCSVSATAKRSDYDCMLAELWRTVGGITEIDL